MNPPWVATSLMLTLTALGGARQEPARAPGAVPAQETRRRVQPFADGVTIDWRFPMVEVDARVVLRSGPLELLACSPRTREHESILQVPARPLHIFQACGLIGLQPGAPVSYDAEHDRWIAPSGQTLTLRALGTFEFGEVSVPVEAWMLNLKEPGREVRTIPWVFAGSRVVEGGAFGADEDGTIVCVVDFSTALITIGELHSADNDLLWLGANPRFIPKEGTRCHLLISARIENPLVLHVIESGELKIADQAVTAAEVAAQWRRVSGITGPEGSSKAGTQEGWRVIELHVSGAVSVATLRRTVEALTAQEIPPAALWVDPRRISDAAARPPAPDPGRGPAPAR